MVKAHGIYQARAAVKVTREWTTTRAVARYPSVLDDVWHGLFVWEKWLLAITYLISVVTFAFKVVGWLW